jgi:outer membrane protein assembly factor BamB
MPSGRYASSLAGFLLILIAAPIPGAQQADSSEALCFVHASDTHAPLAGSSETIAAMKDLGIGEVEPWGFPLPAPEFAVVTGDLTEFGGGASGRAAFDSYLRWFAEAGLTVHHVMGNHDATWDCLRPALRRASAPPNRFFLHGGFGFLILDSSTPQDPRPSFSADEVTFVRTTLARVPPETPLFVFCHHPPDGREFAGARERQRILDLLDGRPVGAWFAGHYHSAFHARVDGLDVVGGGSTLPKNPAQRGFNLVSLRQGMLRVAFRPFDGGKWRALLEKQVGGPWHGALEIEQPEVGQRLKLDDREVPVRAHFRGPAQGIAASVLIEGGLNSAALDPDSPAGGQVRLSGRLPLLGLAPGDYVIRVGVRGQRDENWARTVPVTVDGPGGLEVHWRWEIEGAPRALAVFGDVLLVACSDGTVRGLEIATGSSRFTVQTGGEVLARPLVIDDCALIPSGDGQARAIDRKGRVIWESDLGAASYAAPVLAGRTAIFATNAGTLVGLDPKSGRKSWQSPAAGYSIESPLTFDGERLLFGAWDEHVHAFALESGGPKRLWKCRGQKAKAVAPGVARYYSPADAPPVISGGYVFAPDRGYELSVIDAETGRLMSHVSDVVAAASGPRPGTIVARGRNDEVLLIEKDRVAWRLPAATGPVPVPPVPLGRDGRWLITSDRGEVTIFKCGSESSEARHMLFTGGFHLATPEMAGDLAFFASLDGTVTALRVDPRPEGGGR